MTNQRKDVYRNWQTALAERRTTKERLQQSEQQFRLLVEGVHDYAIYMLDVEGVIVTWNSGAKRIKGYQAEEIIGKHFSCFFRPQDIEAGKPKRALEIAAANGQYGEENLRVRKDGSEFWATVLITALYDSSGKLYGFAKVVRDITERKEAERRLRERERLAILGTTAAVFAHEIGNPLQGLSSSLEIVSDLIRRSPQYSPVAEETIDVARQELQRLAALLDEYRSFARPHSLDIQPTNIPQIFDEVIAPASKHYRECGINLEFDFDDKLPLVPVDREKIKQVILNLCNNAVEAMPDGGTLKCKAYQIGKRVILEVADTGTGIPEGLDVFQLFKTTKPQGTGLGLPVVQQIISEHHGSLDYVTQSGKGTAFKVSLRLSDAE